MVDNIFEKLTPKTLKSFQNLLAVDLILVRPGSWRERKVEKISPVDERSHFSQASVQFLISAEMAYDVLKKLLELPSIQGRDKILIKNLSLDQLQSQTVLGIIPVDRFPKNLRVGFSLTNSKGESIPFLPKQIISSISQFGLQNKIRLLISQESVNKQETEKTREERAERVPELLDHVPNHLFFKALTFSFPNAIHKICLQHELTSSLPKAVTVDFRKSNVHSEVFLTNEIPRYEKFFNFRLPLAYGKIRLDSYRDDIRKFFIQSHSIRTALEKKDVFLEGGNYNLALNPLVLIREYYQAKKYKYEEIVDDLPEFLNDCRVFLLSLGRLIKRLSKAQTQKLFVIINEHINTFFGFCEIPVTIGRHFIIKFEETRETISSRSLSLYQGYKMKLGVESSWHLEIISPSSLELEVVHGKSALYIQKKRQLLLRRLISFLDSLEERKKTRKQDLYFLRSLFELLRCKRKIKLKTLSIEEAYSGERCHYYKNVSMREYGKILQNAKLIDSSTSSLLYDDLILWVKYKSHSRALSAYIFSFSVVFFFLVAMVFFILNPHAVLTSNSGDRILESGDFLSIVAITVTVVIATLNIQEGQRITAPTIRRLRNVTVVTGIGVYGLLAGVLLSDVEVLSSFLLKNWEGLRSVFSAIF